MSIFVVFKGFDTELQQVSVLLIIAETEYYFELTKGYVHGTCEVEF